MEEELQEFKFNYTPTWKGGTTIEEEEDDEEKDDVEEVIKGNTLIDGGELNEKSEDAK